MRGLLRFAVSDEHDASEAFRAKRFGVRRVLAALCSRAEEESTTRTMTAHRQQVGSNLRVIIGYVRRLFVLLVLCSAAGCENKSYTLTGFPWRRAGEGKVQEAANQSLNKETEYYGNIRIVHPHLSFDSAGRPIKKKTIVEIFGFLRKDQTSPILQQSFLLYAHHLKVAERDGTANSCTILLEDRADGEQWRIELGFDLSSKTLSIKKVSPNLIMQK